MQAEIDPDELSRAFSVLVLADLGICLYFIGRALQLW